MPGASFALMPERLLFIGADHRFACGSGSLHNGVRHWHAPGATATLVVAGATVKLVAVGAVGAKDHSGVASGAIHGRYLSF